MSYLYAQNVDRGINMHVVTEVQHRSSPSISCWTIATSRSVLRRSFLRYPRWLLVLMVGLPAPVSAN